MHILHMYYILCRYFVDVYEKVYIYIYIILKTIRHYTYCVYWVKIKYLNNNETIKRDIKMLSCVDRNTVGRLWTKGRAHF